MKEKFYNHVPEAYSNDDFYALCQTFMDVALNADKYKTKDGGIAGNFHLDDMERASKQVKSYLSKYNVFEDDLKHAIRLYAYYSIDDNDKRQKVFFDQNNHRGFSLSHQSGTLYFFTEVPENIVDKIFSNAKTLK